VDRFRAGDWVGIRGASDAEFTTIVRIGAQHDASAPFLAYDRLTQEVNGDKIVLTGARATEPGAKVKVTLRESSLKQGPAALPFSIDSQYELERFFLYGGSPLSRPELESKFAALPSASNVSMLAERFEADNGRIARIILLSTVLAFFTFSGAVALLT